MNDLNTTCNEEEIEREIENFLKKSMKSKYYKTLIKTLRRILIKNYNSLKGYLISKIENEILSKNLKKTFPP